MSLLNYFGDEVCSCKKVHKASVDYVITENGAIKRVPEYIERYGASKAFIMSDINTYHAAAKQVAAILQSKGMDYTEYIFNDTDLKPDEQAVGSAVMHYDTSCDIIIGVGSGCLNDIGKILSKITNCPYIIVGTAPSMDGYASASSSMIRDGLKITLDSKCPNVIIGDIDILKNAPLKMLKSGLGDMIAKYISIAEWRISNIITGEYYCDKVASLVRNALKKCVDNAQKLLERDDEAVAAVFDGLIIGGIAMAYAGVSRPASGIEHYFSHIWDMRALEFNTAEDLHGIQCAVGTLISLRLYEQIKNQKPDRDKALKYAADFDFSDWSDKLRAFLGNSAEAMIALEAKESKYDCDKHRERLDVIIPEWDKILAIIEELPSVSYMEQLFKTIGMPLDCESIGIEKDVLPMTFKSTKDIRDKYVLSRLAWDIGIIDELSEELVK